MGICGQERRLDQRGWGTLALVLALLALLAASLPGPAAAADAVVATAARIGGDATRTRFVADLTKAVSYSVYVLPDPYRVMIDLPDVNFQFPPGIGKETRGLITEYRYGEVAPGKARIVIDTDGPVLIDKSFIVDAQPGRPARVVVDLVKTTEEAFLAAYQADAGASDQAVDAAAAADDAAAPAAPPAAARKPGRKVVVIDPGHGGIDPGAIGLNHTREKDVVFAVATALRGILRDNGTYDVVMTRESDRFITLQDRVKIARDSGADLFIAIHADTVRGQEARGATIYTLSDRASDAEAEALAQKENRADIINGIDLGRQTQEVSDILIDLAQRESKNHSVVFARKAVGELQQVTRFTGKPLRSAGFVVLKAPDVPSVLVELGYLSSRGDEAQLTSSKWQQGVAAAIARAIDKYFATEVASRGQ